MAEQKTLHERWKMDSQEPDGGIRFHETEDNGERAEIVGFSDEELLKILGEEEFHKLKKSNIDDIEEV